MIRRAVAGVAIAAVVAATWAGSALAAAPWLILVWGHNGRDRPRHALRPDDADQHGTFCPAYGERPPTIRLPLAEHPEPAVAPADVLEMLAAAGVPVRVAPRDDERLWPVLGVAAAAAVGAGIAIASALRRK